VVNIGAGDRVTINELLERIADKMGRSGVRADFQAPRAGDVRHSQADLSRARELLGYRPFASLAQGLEETVAWFEEAATTSGDHGAGS
jgi:UDP-N-acetylglucosamine 4-epimerase